MRNLEFFDTNDAIDNIGGDEEIYLEILKTFADTYGDDFLKKEAPELLNLDSLQILENADLCEKFGKAFHKIKGSSLTVGANKLGEIAKSLETFFRYEERKSPSDSADELNTLVKNFQEIYKATTEELHSLFSA